MRPEPSPAAPAPGIAVVYQDDALVVLNKPAGLLSVPGRGEDKQDCLSRRVQDHFPDALVVHRLDMATSGLLVMARGAAVQRQLSAAFAQRQVHKHYIAVVHGDGRREDDGAWQTIDLPMRVDWERRPLQAIDLQHGKASVTRWRCIGFDTATQTSRMELEPHTGRSHQLRLHLQAIGHPIVGDALYASLHPAHLAPHHGPQQKAACAAAPTAVRLLLHADALAFTHPVTGSPLQLHSPCPF
jgi:tRNA pseudouridine32 synthase/23S rRNA pseudouridine746 synthase